MERNQDMGYAEGNSKMASEHAWTVIRVSSGIDGEASTPDQLRSRIEQQSQLIAILKQRADTNLIQSEAYKKECECLTTQVQQLELRVQEELKRRELVEARFDVLAKNHDEMIKLKDEYKSACHRLKLEWEELQSSSHAQSSAALQDRESELTKLRGKVRELEEGREAMEEGHSVLEGRCQQLECSLQRAEQRRELEGEEARAEVLALKSSLLDSEERQAQLRAAADSKQMKIDEYAIINDQLEKLVTIQDGNIKAQARTIDQLRTQLSDAQREEAAVKERFCSRSEEVSRDAQVMKLKNELLEANSRLTQLDKEFQAYKRHSMETLKQERELNSKLRHFAE